MRRRLLDGSGCSQVIDIIDKIDTVAGDICIVDNNTLDKYFIEPDTIELINTDCYTPIGVVVVPASHTDDSTARIISLADMDYSNPDNGRIEGHAHIYWGGSGYDISTLDNKTVFPCISTDLKEITAEMQSIIEWSNLNSYSCYLPSDQFNIYPNPYDEGTFYRAGTTSSTYHAGPSPYLTGSLKNDIYHDISNMGSILSDMNGKSNTEKILAVDNGMSTDWQITETISNVYDNEYIHPVAQCCWRYHTIGTSQGDWYLPSAGELGYLASRWKTINLSIQKIIDFNISSALVLPANYNWWSSTECSTSFVINLNFNSNSAFLNSSYNKDNYNIDARAFLAV